MADKSSRKSKRKDLDPIAASRAPNERCALFANGVKFDGQNGGKPREIGSVEKIAHPRAFAKEQISMSETETAKPLLRHSLLAEAADS